MISNFIIILRREFKEYFVVEIENFLMVIHLDYHVPFFVIQPISEFINEMMK